MKKTILMLMLMVSGLFAEAHYLNKLCWSPSNGGKYSFSATNGPNGTATITVYSNSNYTGQIQQFNVNVTGGGMTFEVNQPNRTTIVYVKVKWNGDNYINQSPSGTNQCTIVPIIFGNITAYNVGDKTIITAQILSTDETNQVTLKLNMPDGTVRQYPIIFLDKLYNDDIWIITVNNKTQTYTLKKK